VEWVGLGVGDSDNNNMISETKTEGARYSFRGNQDKTKIEAVSKS